jgi:hypothetical protein
MTPVLDGAGLLTPRAASGFGSAVPGTGGNHGIASPNPTLNLTHERAASTPILDLRCAPCIRFSSLPYDGPGTHRRIKGLRLTTAYGIAAMLGTMGNIARGLPDELALNSRAGGFALWASASEGRTTRAESSRDLLSVRGPLAAILRR